jgi:hypothetical protein
MSKVKAKPKKAAKASAAKRKAKVKVDPITLSVVREACWKLRSAR